MRYAKSFFELQLRFVAHAARLSARPLPELLLSHSNFYIRFAAGRRFDPAHPVWQAYLAGLSQDADFERILAWTWRYYLSRSDEDSGPELIAKAGCFSLSAEGNEGVRMHFSHADPAAATSLGSASLPQRRAELTALFRSLSLTHPEIRQITGMSWLYNLQAYRRLFPDTYTASAQAVAPRYHSMTLWGQFLNRAGDVKAELAETFYHRLAEAREPSDLAKCFPLQVIKVTAAIESFHHAYGFDVTRRP